MGDTREETDWRNQNAEDHRGGVVFLGEEDIVEGVQACANSLTGRIFANRQFTMGTMENALTAIWGKPKGIRVTEIKSNVFQFFFDMEEELLRIEQGSPWLFKNFVLHVRRWNIQEEAADNVISKFPVWVQLWGIPEKFKTLESGRKIGESLGKVSDLGFLKLRERKTESSRLGLIFVVRKK
ncbi:uncharacterized protein LOC107646844 [Arachis ipaensis]|uniref:uncharacterized protein LOC107646844 n=1 Tax=Arachis ipaensis TaxID=130454 RepID=UPI0007AF1778|nr:uncharacterized protein LOC107646844 [Arachis ipaensis]XP_025627905.1 uncharacterized protein LOC112721034 [Arachis hypogaea]